MNEINVEELQQDYLIVRNALETLTYAVSEGAGVGKALEGARTALQWTKTLIELGEDCDCEGDNK